MNVRKNVGQQEGEDRFKKPSDNAEMTQFGQTKDNTIKIEFKKTNYITF